MKRMLARVGGLVVGVALAVPVHLVGSTAQAACIMNASERWTPPAGPIPVYVSDDTFTLTSLKYTGLGTDSGSGVNDEIRWVKEALAIINEGSHDAPRLYYAGTDANVDPYALTFWSSRQPGITVSTYGNCTFEPTGELARTTSKDDKAAIRMRRGTGGADFGQGGSDYSCNPDAPLVWWTDPGDDNPPGAGQSQDFVSVLVHELGHALGLAHTDGSYQLGCDDTLGLVPIMTANSVMYPPLGWEKSWRRRLRRDDVEALRALWGEPARNIRWSYSTASTPTSLSWVVPQTIASGTLFTNTPVTLTNASRNDDETILAGFTNAADEVRYFVGDWSGWPTVLYGTKVPHPSGGTIYSFDRVAVARGEDYDGGYGPQRRLVAWHGTDESTCCGAERVLPWDDLDEPEVFDTRIWWRVHDGSTWRTPQRTATTKYKELGVGYDPAEDLFVMAYIDTCEPEGDTCADVPDTPADQWLYVRTIDASLGVGGCTQALTTAGHVLAVGDVACDYRGSLLDTRCVIPVTTVSEAGGPEVRYIEGEIEPHDNKICFVRKVDPPTTVGGVLGLGTPSAALDGYLTPGSGSSFLGAYVPGLPGTTPQTSDWSRVYTLTRDASSGWVVLPMANEKTFVTNYWPLAVGSMSETTGSEHTQWRTIPY